MYNQSQVNPTQMAYPACTSKEILAITYHYRKVTRRPFLAPNTNYHELHLERISVFTGNLLVAVLLNTWVLLEPETP